MNNISTYQSCIHEEWLDQLVDVITDYNELLQFLSLKYHPYLTINHFGSGDFPLRIPRTFAERMRKGDPKDPLLLQVITSDQEYIDIPGYNVNPLNEQNSIVPGLLHKYRNRVLFLVKGNCAVHCRYCFRRYFPYQLNKGNKHNWEKAILYIQEDLDLDEVIISGGDPLMAKDDELDWIITKLEKISHLKRVRIHSRLPVVIPKRITKVLCKRLEHSRLQILLVTHINHMKEINDDLKYSMYMLKSAGVTLLNQSVLLREINDSSVVLAELSNALFDIGILPYYLHLLDKVKGTAHFYVSDQRACAIIRELLTMVSGYMVPRLVREIGGEPSKTLINLHMKQE
ncbi:EF-P beta-lysylation protein EpmB [Candidatus Erwinia haradaeae]|uniref:L-lysine 2,3-aminomutase n=1 Tax=Candidatus Erwinia haradaeae TaxID=1922217 RepID=A0A803FTS1_9GAMM|nr:EF-P beta-lysylation protein EpmB [Candidatus Erwinia haradaeae]VFP88232.1 L-lysine 2,3-aminomutase [Candidatus Erwinia haradaeae]